MTLPLPRALRQPSEGPRWLGALLARLPAPPTSALLDPLRAAQAETLLQAHGQERAEIAALLAQDPAAGRPALAALAERLLAELRAGVAQKAGAAGLIARFDALFPTSRPEIMDDPGLCERRRQRIHRGVERLGRWSGTYARLSALLRPFARRGAPLRVLDVGSGDGGFVLAVHRWARREGLDVQITASDLQPALVAELRSRMAAAGVAPRAVVFDALNPDIPPGAYDVITCTHALHHLRPGAVAVLYAEAARLAGRGVLLVDLWRSAELLAGLTAATALATASLDAAHDAFVSVRRALAPAELRLLTGCGPRPARVRVLPPGWIAAELRPPSLSLPAT